MKILICYFSGTGNTKRVIDEYVKYFTSKNNIVDLYNIENDNFDKDLNEYDLIGFGHPIYAFNAPSIIVKFVKSLRPLTSPKKIFIIKSSGEPLRLNNSSSNKIRRMLKKRNMFITYERHYVMPYNIIFRHTDYEAFKMISAMQKVVPFDAQEVLDEKTNILKPIVMGKPFGWVLRIEFIGGRFNGLLYRVNKKCIHCMKCVKNCPKNNISYDKEKNKFHFGNKCLMCMRCSINCPVNSLKIGLFNKWKVNGNYTFKEEQTNKKNHHNWYCKKAYIKYYENIEKRCN